MRVAAQGGGRGLEALQPVLLVGDLARQGVVLRAQDLNRRVAPAGSWMRRRSMAVPVAIAILEAAAKGDPGLEAPAVLLVVALGEVACGPGLPSKLVGGLAVNALRGRAGRGCRLIRSRHRVPSGCRDSRVRVPD